MPALKSIQIDHLHFQYIFAELISRSTQLLLCVQTKNCFHSELKPKMGLRSQTLFLFQKELALGLLAPMYLLKELQMLYLFSLFSLTLQDFFTLMNHLCEALSAWFVIR